MARARGYDPLHVSEANTRLLDALVAHARARGPGHVAVFDLDGCLFDTRPRQVRILRELASREGLHPLYRVEPHHFRDWSLRGTLLHAGLDPAWVDAHAGRVRAWWERCFFTSEYVVHDHAMPGAVELVRAVHDAGLHVVYLTGRDVSMAPGTEATLHRYGFPLAMERCTLLVKPDAPTDDTVFKEVALRRVDTMGTAALYLDNEPANVNMYRRVHPGAMVVFVETDHSPRPDEPDPGIPWLRSFLRG